MPRTCPRCHSVFEDEAEVCWSCRVRLVDRRDGEEDLDTARDRFDGEDAAETTEGTENEGTGDRVWVDLMPVYFAPDEFSALAVQRVLEEAEIRSHVKSVQIPWADGIMQNIHGYWGQVLVAGEDLDQAREIVGEYLQSIERTRKEDVDPGVSN